MTDPILKRIQELCTDIMDLKLGCKVEDSHDIFTFVSSTDEDHFLLWKDDTVSRHVSGFEHLHVLGTDPTLAVILRALSKVGAMTEGANALINIIDVNAPDIRWNLEHDSFAWHVENQPETIKFIGSLLGV